MALRSDLERLGLRSDQVLDAPAELLAYECDAYTVDRSLPDAVVLPESTEQVADVVRFCRDQSIPFTPRGAGTGLSGGAMAAKGGVVVSTKRLTKVLEVDLPNRRLRAQSGVVNRKITQAVQPMGLHFAPDPSSQSVCTLGGNIAENSGGPHTLKYGVTAQHVLAVTLVTVEGDVVDLGSPVPGWPGPSLVSLVVGSEGTLGIVTEAWVRLTPLPPSTETALASFPSVESATQAVADIIASGVLPAALEMMDRGVLSALRVAFGLEYPEGADALLLVECDGEDRDQVLEDMAVAKELCARQGSLKWVQAASEVERQRLWTARKKGIGAMGRLAPSIVTHDGVIPRSRLPEMLTFVGEVASHYGLGCANLFHAGDGNLHPCFYFDEREPGAVERVVQAGEAILRRCIELGGSVSGEHGIGVEKLDFMPLMFSEADLDLQRRTKQIFNSGELGNPCKVLPNQKGCSEHRHRWRVRERLHPT